MSISFLDKGSSNQSVALQREQHEEYQGIFRGLGEGLLDTNWSKLLVREERGCTGKWNLNSPLSQNVWRKCHKQIK